MRIGRPREYNLGYILSCFKFAYEQCKYRLLSESVYKELAEAHELPSTYTVLTRTRMGWRELRDFIEKYRSFNDEELELQCKIHNMCGDCPHEPWECQEDQMDCYKLAERFKYFEII